MIARIRKREEIAEGTLLVELDASPSPEFKPGQYMTMSLPKPPYTDEKGNMRVFSIVNSPGEKNTLTIATRLSPSAFKRSLAEMAIGADVDVKFIGGKFLLPEPEGKGIVFIAGGIGITPFVSMLRHVDENRLDADITLIYSNRNQKSTAFFEELKAIAKRNKNVKLVMAMTDDLAWKGERSQISAELVKRHVPGYADSLFMIVGPGGMVAAMSDMLSGIGVAKENIMVESFTGY
jgi:ferredoxin-NADP reductase